MSITKLDINNILLKKELKHAKDELEKVVADLELHKTLLKQVEKNAKRYQFMRINTYTINWEAFPYINGHNPHDLDHEIDKVINQ